MADSAGTDINVTSDAKVRSTKAGFCLNTKKGRSGAAGKRRKDKEYVTFSVKDLMYNAWIKSDLDIDPSLIVDAWMEDCLNENPMLQAKNQKFAKPAPASKRCSTCQKSVTIKHFKRHEEIHRQPRPTFRCEVCQMDLSRKDSLKRHSRIHAFGH